MLKTLLEKSGVHSALKHDEIVEATPEAILVEKQAALAAKRASAALQKSLDQLKSREVGSTTWTGKFGSAGGPAPLKRCVCVLCVN